MKLTKYLLPVVALAAMLSACDSCDLEPVIPPVDAPVDTTQASMTILEFKQKYWTTDENSMELIGNMPDGSPTLLRGRVVSNDSTGNCYKQLVLRDETAAITLTVNVSDMYRIYPYGAEFLVDVSSLYVGMYRNFLQVGAKEPTRTSPYNIPEDQFKPLIHGNGWPYPAEAQPVEMDLAALRTLKTAEGLQEWQSQLVTFTDVEFESVGEEFSPTYGSTVSQYVKDDKGNRIALRFSGRSAFAHRVVPGGKGSVTGILSYYNSDWQLIPCTLSDLKGFTPVSGNVSNPTGDGTEASPYNVAAAIANQGGSGWVKGYIVGVMNSNADYTMEMAAPFTVNSNVYIADDPKETVTARMLPVQLPVGDVRKAVNLVDNPGNLGKVLTINGDFTAYFSQPGIKNATAYKLDGQGGGTVTPPSGATSTFSRATEIADGKYIIWSDNVVATPLTKNYGYLPMAACTPGADGNITTSEANLYTFKKEAAGWTIADSNGKYVYMKDAYNSFNLADALDSSDTAYFWNITAAADGSFTIVNVGKNKTLRYSAQYTSFGAYPDASNGTATYLYQPVK